MKASEFLSSYHKIMESMCSYHELFYRIAITGQPILTKDIPTAAVSFNRDGNFLNFMFNPDFIEKLSWEEIRFVCCHEMLHILYNHGYRNKDNQINAQLSNVAMDIVVNHSLLDNFGFLKGDLDFLTSDEMGVCFKDTVFGDKADKIRDRDTFEYYYLRIAEDAEKIEASGVMSGPNGGTLDDHSKLPSLSKEQLQDVLEEALGDGDAAKDLVEALEKSNQAGKNPSPTTFNVINKRIRKKRKWSSIVSKIRKSKIAKGEADGLQWAKMDRRNNILGGDFILPNVGICDDIAMKKWDLWMFMDVSGSCVDYFERFIDAARGIPTDVFDIKFHTFDTSVERIDIRTKSCPCGGGTRFDIIEDYIQQDIKKTKKRYPKLVFVITDGYGTSVLPKSPKNWSWFMTEDNIRDYIHKDSKVYDLSEFDNKGSNR